MGLDYFAKKGGCFSVNTAGADVLGLLYKNLGLPLYDLDLQGSIEGRVSRIKGFAIARAGYVLEADQAVAVADAIQAKSDDEISAAIQLIFDEGHDLIDPGDPRADTVAWFRLWERFLRGCGGYSTDPEWPRSYKPQWDEP